MIVYACAITIFHRGTVTTKTAVSRAFIASNKIKLFSNLHLFLSVSVLPRYYINNVHDSANCIYSTISRHTIR